jgi:hypothetical protein
MFGVSTFVVGYESRLSRWSSGLDSYPAHNYGRSITDVNLNIAPDVATATGDVTPSALQRMAATKRHEPLAERGDIWFLAVHVLSSTPRHYSSLTKPCGETSFSQVIIPVIPIQNNGYFRFKD